MSFAGFLNENVQIEEYAGVDDYGSPSFSSAVTYKARIEWGAKVIISPSGEEVVSTARVFISRTTPFDSRSRITLPPNWGPINPPIIRVQPAIGGRGVHHTAIYL